MTVFADSSALVKRYADEDAHELVRSIAEPLVVSSLARVEVPAALWRKQRLDEVGAEDAAVLIAAFEADLFGADTESPQFAAIALTARVLDEAALLCARHPLRAGDAVQLASAAAARAADPECATVAAFDLVLRRAAAAEGFALVPEAWDRPAG